MARALVSFSLLFSVLVIAPAHVHGQARPNFQGVWSTTMTTPDDEAWRLEDFGCFIGCPAIVYQRLRELLNDPANDDRPYEQLLDEATRHGRGHFAGIVTPKGLALRDALGLSDDRAINCERPGFVRQVLNPVPLEITQHGDRVVMRYEAGGVVRTVYMDGRGHPQDTLPSLHGHSVGRYEGAVLVIETRGIAANSFWPGYGGHSDQLRAVERYTRSDDGSWLRLELTFEDPVMLQQPWVHQKVWRFTPDVQILEHGSCEAISGQR